MVTARKSGIVVLIGANKGGTARVQLFQGTGRKNKKPKAGKSVRLRVPGPTRVVLKSQKLKKGYGARKPHSHAFAVERRPRSSSR